MLCPYFFLAPPRSRTRGAALALFFSATFYAPEKFGAADMRHIRPLPRRPIVRFIFVGGIYAPAAFAFGSALISIFRGSAASVTGAAISSTPSLYSAASFDASTPSGSITLRSNRP